MFLAILIVQWTILIPVYYSGNDAENYLNVENDTVNQTLAKNMTNIVEVAENLDGLRYLQDIQDQAGEENESESESDDEEIT